RGNETDDLDNQDFESLGGLHKFGIPKLEPAKVLLLALTERVQVLQILPCGLCPAIDRTGHQVERNNTFFAFYRDLKFQHLLELLLFHPERLASERHDLWVVWIPKDRPKRGL